MKIPSAFAAPIAILVFALTTLAVYNQREYIYDLWDRLDQVEMQDFFQASTEHQDNDTSTSSSKGTYTPIPSNSVLPFIIDKQSSTIVRFPRGTRLISSHETVPCAHSEKEPPVSYMEYTCVKAYIRVEDQLPGLRNEIGVLINEHAPEKGQFEMIIPLNYRPETKKENGAENFMERVGITSKMVLYSLLGQGEESHNPR